MANQPRVRTRVRTRTRPTAQQSEFERINAPRVAKLIKMLEVIETSARSNRVPEHELAALLRPVAQALPAAKQAAAAQGPGVPIPGRDRADIRAAMDVMQQGDIRGGFKKLRSVVCGWVTPEPQ